ncbi:alpha-glucosidase/alpha-galactosidase [Pelagovum pacificum]|uniref:Alpha-glucosidase/alpha-galactosidase n=1 Tax=Pelagovum pacificum TaxID=2588711 RepID=A0A5C5GEP7_9RHOB|nr:alpha-glucosidase/alpha-galactosidase [Pelagovum pacificum]QQA44464.1 alpha-glucosidase/alpha-galactosidase [Pelagovum pacificum]TNY32421.1 alpha-glucosidase/alpha-galactosidase [Pelagovum pacificum]
MTRICLVGAGSTVFAQNILGDVLSNPELQHAEIALHDIDGERLKTSGIVARRIGETLGIRDLKVEEHLERRPALKGADFVILMMQVGGYKPATVTDFEVPAKYGLGQTIGDTLGIGGIMRGLRTIPVLFDICRDMEELCPDAIMLQYVNPMAMNCWAIKDQFAGLRTVGLCHSVQETAHDLASVLGEDPATLNYRCGGINHVAFYDRFEKVFPDGSREDLYPRLKQIAQERTYPEYDEVRFDMLRRVGHFVTESSMHFSEYSAWYLKATQPENVEKNKLRIGEYLYRCEDQIEEWHELRRELEGDAPLEVEKSNEYAAGIIQGVVTGAPQQIYGNVPNDGLIANLPDDCIVEVPCMVDRNGVQPTKLGAIPSHLASIMGLSIAVQREVVNAAVTGKREHIYHAAMLDPHTAGELNLDQIWHLVDDLIEAHGNWLPAYH